VKDEKVMLVLSTCKEMRKNDQIKVTIQQTNYKVRHLKGQCIVISSGYDLIHDKYVSYVKHDIRVKLRFVLNTTAIYS